MSPELIYHDLYFAKKKYNLKSDVKPLSCSVCKKELNGISITAKKVNDQTVFLCSHHYWGNLNQKIIEKP